MFCNCPQQEVSALPTTVSRTAQMALQAALASPSSTAGNAADEAEPSNAISTFTRPPEPAEPEQSSPKTESSTRLVCVTVCVAVMLVGGGGGLSERVVFMYIGVPFFVLVNGWCGWWHCLQMCLCWLTHRWEHYLQNVCILVKNVGIIRQNYHHAFVTVHASDTIVFR